MFASVVRIFKASSSSKSVLCSSQTSW